MTNRFVVQSPFLGWPIPGAKLDGGSPTHWVLFPYDPYFSPTSLTFPRGSPKGDLLRLDYNNNNFDYGTVWDYEPDYPGKTDPVPLIRILSESAYPTDIGGSARPGRTLHGKQYWEVLVIALPTDVPSQQTVVTLPGGEVGTLTTYTNPCGIYYTWTGTGPPTPEAGEDKATLIWPAQLNTFFSPTIGLWPKCPTFGKYDLIGLDSPAAALRSIGVTRTSLMQGTFTTTSPGIPNFQHLYGDLFKAADISAGINGVNGEFVGRDETGTYTNPDLTIGDCAFIGDGGVRIPFDSALPAPGAAAYHSPVFKGRADDLTSIKTFGTDAVNGGGPYPSPAGIWTGVDLGGPWVAGGPNTGDRIMIATDTQSRKVWFGINGHFIAPGGGFAHPETGAGWACYMDGPANASNYYPGVSYRVGPVALEMIFDSGGQKYPAPPGFSTFFARFF